MYREGLKAAQDRLEQARTRVNEREARLDAEQLGLLPRRLRKRLAKLKAKTELAAETVDAVTDAEDALDEYDDWLSVAFDLVAQVEGARERGETGWRAWLLGRRRGLMQPVLPRRLVLIVGGLIATAVALIWAPDWLMDGASDAAYECFDEIEQTGSGDPASCHQRLRLLWPVALPWTRPKALRRWRSIAGTVAESELDTATATKPDAQARRRAADTVLANADAPAQPWTRTVVASTGAWAAVAALDPVAGNDTALRAAIALGDLDRAETLAAFEDEGSASYDANLTRGSWLCLLGNREAGLAALVRADQQYGSEVNRDGTGMHQARLAMIACGGTRASVGFDPTHVTSYARGAMLVLQMAPLDWQKGRRLAHIEVLGEHGPSSDCMAAGAISSWDFELPRLLDMVYSGGEETVVASLSEGAGPARILDLGNVERGDRCPAEWLEAAAVQVAAKIPSAPPQLEAAAEHRGQLLSDSEKQELARAHAHPPKTLRRAAWRFWVLAANARSRRGQVEQARADLAKARGLAVVYQSALLPGPELAAGDAAAALELLAPTLADPERLPRQVIAAARTNQARALARQGSFEKAYEAIKRAHWDATRAGSGATEANIAAIAWLRAALALKTGADEELPDLPELPRPEEEGPEEETPLVCEEPLACLAFWWDLAQRPTNDRRGTRISAPVIGQIYEIADLAARMYVVGKTAEGDGDIEVWLDRIFSRLHLSGDPRVPLARAEAARWRGDEQAAQQWDERAQQLLSLIDDYPSEILAAAVVK